MRGELRSKSDASRQSTQQKSRFAVEQYSEASQPLSHSTVQRAVAAPNQLTAGDVIALQRTIGNAEVQRILTGRDLSRTDSAPSAVHLSTGSSIQPKLTVGPAGDKYEQEADAIAARVTQTHSVAQRDLGPRMSKVVGPEGGGVDNDIEGQIRSGNGGTSLPPGVRGKLEPKLGADLSQIKIHTDSRAVQLNRNLGAQAFTHKNHIYYGDGQTPNNLRLTAHEAVHTIQQGATRQVQRSSLLHGQDMHVHNMANARPNVARNPRHETVQRVGSISDRKAMLAQGGMQGVTPEQKKDDRYYQRFAQELRKVAKRKISEPQMRDFWKRFTAAMREHAINLPGWNQVENRAETWQEATARGETLHTTEEQFAKKEAFRKEIQFLFNLVEPQGQDKEILNPTFWSNVAMGRPAANDKGLTQQLGSDNGGTAMNETGTGKLMDLLTTGAREGEVPDLVNLQKNLMFSDKHAYMNWGANSNVWAASSADFAAKATGVVHVYVPEGISTASVFWTTELPVLKARQTPKVEGELPKVTDIRIHQLSPEGAKAVADAKVGTIDQATLTLTLRSAKAWTNGSILGSTIKGLGGNKGISGGKLTTLASKWKGYSRTD